MSDEQNIQKPKVGVFVCHCGGNISSVIDVKRVAEELAKVEGVELSIDYEFMCSDPGQGKIVSAIKDGTINRVVVAACSPRLHELTFRRNLVEAGLNPYLLEQANIREQGSWVHKMDHEGATAKAIRLAKAAIEKVKLSKPLDRIEVKSLPAALIVGGGVSGMRAALDLAQKGADVHLVEKTPYLGGNTMKIDKLFPTEESAKDIISILTDEIDSNEKIHVYTNAEIESISGAIGNFATTLKVKSRGVDKEIPADKFNAAVRLCPEESPDGIKNNAFTKKAIYHPYLGAYPSVQAIDWESCTKCGKCKKAASGFINLEYKETLVDIETGVIIIATGYEHYEPSTGELGYGDNKNVITLPQYISIMEDRLDDENKLFVNGKEIKSIGFIHCVGSRQIEGIHEPGPDGTINEHCSRVCCTATLQAVNELKEKLPNIDVYDLYRDIRTYGRDHELKYYDKASKNNVIFVKFVPEEAPQFNNNGNKIEIKVKDLLTSNEELEFDVDLLVLATGMLPANPGMAADKFKLPKSTDRFLNEMHPKLRPVETAVGGVFIAGTAQAPFDTGEAAAAAGSAAVKAAVILEGKDVHLEPYIANVNLDKCCGSGECVKICPTEGAITLVEKEINGEKVMRAEVNEMLCTGCSVCISKCPTRALDINGYEIRQFEAMIDAIVSEKQ